MTEHRDAIALEAYLALLYTDARARDVFAANPLAAARAHGVGEIDARSLMKIDMTGLNMAADSYAHKREQHRAHKSAKTAFSRVFRKLLGKS